MALLSLLLFLPSLLPSPCPCTSALTPPAPGRSMVSISGGTDTGTDTVVDGRLPTLAAGSDTDENDDNDDGDAIAPGVFYK